MSEQKPTTERTNKPPVPHKMADKAKRAGLTIEEFFFRELKKYGSINAAALANDMKANSWLHWAKKFGVRSRVTVTVEYEVDKE